MIRAALLACLGPVRRWSAPSSDTKLRGCRAVRKISLAFLIPTVLSVGEHYDQRPFQRADLFAQVARPDVLDEVPPQGERLAADQERRLPFGEDSFHKRVVVVLHVPGIVRRADAGHRTHQLEPAGRSPPHRRRSVPPGARTMRPDSFMNIAAWMVSATLCENEPSPQSPSESPSPRLSKRSIPTPSRANSLQIRLAAGLSLPRVKPWENTPHPRIGTSGWSTRPASRGPLVLVNHTRSATLPIPSTLIPQLRSVRTEDTQAAKSPDEPVQRGR